MMPGTTAEPTAAPAPPSRAHAAGDHPHEHDPSLTEPPPRRSDLVAGVALLACAARADAFFGDDVATESARLVRVLDLRPGMTVADVGAGDGAYALAIAKVVGPTGHVFATEMEQDQRDDIQSAATHAGLANVTVLAAGTDTTNLAAGCCDVVLMRGVYHHLTAPAAIDASICAALKPGGLFAVVDFPPSFWLSPWTPEGIPADRGGHGIPIDVLVREVEAAGFTKVSIDDDWPTGLLTDLYCVVFRKPDGTGDAVAADADAPAPASRH